MGTFIPIQKPSSVLFTGNYLNWSEYGEITYSFTSNHRMSMCFLFNFFGRISMRVIQFEDVTVKQNKNCAERNISTSIRCSHWLKCKYMTRIFFFGIVETLIQFFFLVNFMSNREHVVFRFSVFGFNEGLCSACWIGWSLKFAFTTFHHIYLVYISDCTYVWCFSRKVSRGIYRYKHTSAYCRQFQMMLIYSNIRDILMILHKDTSLFQRWAPIESRIFSIVEKGKFRERPDFAFDFYTLLTLRCRDVINQIGLEYRHAAESCQLLFSYIVGISLFMKGKKIQNSIIH